MFERYYPQIVLPEVGIIGQQKLKKAKVLCIGAGGLGCSALQSMVAAGIGHIGICDGDTVSLSNLQRQVLYDEENINQMKSTTAIKHLAKLNSAVELKDIPEYINANNVINIITEYDYIIDASDNFQTKLLLNDACHWLQKPLISGSVQQFRGQLSVFLPKKPCLRCVFEDLEKAQVPNCTQSGVIGAVPGLFGLLQAFEVMKLCLDLPSSMVGNLCTWDLLRAMPRITELSVNPSCPLCTGRENFVTLWQNETAIGKAMTINQISVAQLIERIEANEEIFLLDVRNPEEYEAFNLGGYLLPFSELSQRIDELPRDKSIVVHCHTGPRSEMAVEFLQAAGFTDVSNLTGGIMAFHQMSHGHSCEHC